MACCDFAPRLRVRSQQKVSPEVNRNPHRMEHSAKPFPKVNVIGTPAIAAGGDKDDIGHRPIVATKPQMPIATADGNADVTKP